jgi:hypothetical protein
MNSILGQTVKCVYLIIKIDVVHVVSSGSRRRSPSECTRFREVRSFPRCLLLRERPHILTPIVAVWVAAPVDRLVVARHPDHPVVARGAAPIPVAEPDPDPADRGPVRGRAPDAFLADLRDGGVLRLFDEDGIRGRVEASDELPRRDGVGVRRGPAPDPEQEYKGKRSSYGLLPPS